MGLEEWLDIRKRAEGRLTIFQTEGRGLYNDVTKQLDNELARVERGTAELQLVANGLLDEARARLEHRKRLLGELFPSLVK